MKRRNEDANFENILSFIKNSQKPSIKREKSDPGIGGDHPAWDIIIQKLDYKSQRKLSHQNQRLSDIVKINAESEIRKFKRHIREDKYM